MADITPSITHFRYSIRGLLLLTFIIAVSAASCGYLCNVSRSITGYSPYHDYVEWPRALRTLIGRDEVLRRDVEPFGRVGWFDHYSVWRIKAGSPLRERLFANHQLTPAASSHPKAQELIESCPSAWGRFRRDRATWFATPGYGVAHIEGLDLFLVADDPATGDTFILHEWHL